MDRRTGVGCPTARTIPLGQYSEWIDVGFVEQKRSPKPEMKQSMCPILSGIKVSNTNDIIVKIGCDWTKQPVHDRVLNAIYKMPGNA